MTDEIKDKQKEIPTTDGEKLEESNVSIYVKSIGKNFEVSIKTSSSFSTISQTIDNIIQEVNKSKSFKPLEINIQKFDTSSKPSDAIASPTLVQENKVALFAKRIGVDSKKLVDSEIIGIKNDDVQIIETPKFKPNEAGLLILSIKDLVFGQKSVSFDDWKTLCEASGIKSNTPFYMLASNYTLTRTIDKTKYKNSRELVINSKGEGVVRTALERILSQM